MDAIQFGVVVRMRRIRRGWRQQDLASAAGVTRSDVSRVERGGIDRLPLWKIKAVAAPLEIRVELLARSRGADLDRLVGSRRSCSGVRRRPRGRPSRLVINVPGVGI